MATNTASKAAWLKGKMQYPFVVEDAPIPKPGEGELVVKNHAVAINPVDWKIQQTEAQSNIIKTYPFIIGEESTGIVHSVHTSASHLFSPGDRVLTTFDGSLTRKPRNGAFASYSVANAALTAKLPAHVSFADGAVLPLALTTAAAALYQKAKLALPLPSPDAQQPNPEGRGRVILVWGGASSVGNAAIQLAKASGLTVITTASAANKAMCRGVGADFVFDYKDVDVIQRIVDAVEGVIDGQFAGVFDAISEESTLKACVAVCQAVGGTQKIIKSQPHVGDGLVPAGIECESIYATTIMLDEVGPALWRDYIPEALANGTLKCMPPPLVVGREIENVQAAVDRAKQGVSGRKIVLEL